jgi:hypothetical protein
MSSEIGEIYLYRVFVLTPAPAGDRITHREEFIEGAKGALSTTLNLVGSGDYEGLKGLISAKVRRLGCLGIYQYM